jgi:hypothetical protein
MAGICGGVQAGTDIEGEGNHEVKVVLDAGPTGASNSTDGRVAGFLAASLAIEHEGVLARFPCVFEDGVANDVTDPLEAQSCSDPVSVEISIAGSLGDEVEEEERLLETLFVPSDGCASER